MDSKKIKAILDIGETIAVEFKRCGNGIESDVYETVCSFLNRFGGDIFLGVLDDGTVLGCLKRLPLIWLKIYKLYQQSCVIYADRIFITRNYTI